MEAFKSYLLTAMIAALVSSLAIRITDPRHRSYIRYIAGLILLLLLSSPLVSLAGEFGEVLDQEAPAAAETQEDAFISEMGKTMSSQIGDLVSVRYQIPRESISVKLTLDLADLSAIEFSRVDLVIRAPCNADAIEQYLAESLNCVVEVTVEEVISTQE